MTKFTPEQLDVLRREWSKIERVSPDRLPQFHALLERMNDAQLAQVADAGIKFLSKLALNEMVRRLPALGSTVTLTGDHYAGKRATVISRCVVRIGVRCGDEEFEVYPGGWCAAS